VGETVPEKIKKTVQKLNSACWLCLFFADTILHFHCISHTGSEKTLWHSTKLGFSIEKLITAEIDRALRTQKQKKNYLILKVQKLCTHDACSMHAYRLFLRQNAYSSKAQLVRCR